MTGPQLHTLEGIVQVTPVQARTRPHSGQLLRRVPVGELLGRPVAPAPLRHAHRAGVLDPDRLCLRLHLGLHGPAHPVQGSRVRRHGPQQLPHHRQAGRGMGRRRRAHALLQPRVDRRPADRPADPGGAVAFDHRRQGKAAGRHDRQLARLRAAYDLLQAGARPARSRCCCWARPASARSCSRARCTTWARAATSPSSR